MGSLGGSRGLRQDPGARHGSNIHRAQSAAVSSAFFEGQRQASQRARLLIVLFFSSVLAVVGSLAWLTVVLRPHMIRDDPDFPITDAQLAATVGGLALMTIIATTARRLYALSKGGRSLAELLGARELLPADLKDPRCRMLRNVVDEMAIASATPRPAVFVLQDRALNALVAGFSSHDAALYMTWGCLERLSRDELQAVVAHEFSHSVRGDMRLNTVLVGATAGLNSISHFGYEMLRSGSRTRGSGRSRSSAGPIGLLIFVVGYLGVILASIIKAAVSRQQEHFADAAAVQYTRNPLALARVLHAIRNAGPMSYLTSQGALDVAHMCIAASASRVAEGLFATHPPLNERIRRIAPDFAPSRDERQASPETLVSSVSESKHSTDADASIPHLSPVALAALCLESLEPKVRESVDTPEGSVALLLALVVSRDPQVRKTQLQCLSGPQPLVSVSLVSEVWQHLRGLNFAQLLALCELAISSLGRLPQPQIREFQDIVHRWINADRHIDLMELMLACGMFHALDHSRRGRRMTRTWKDLLPQISAVFSALVSVAHEDESERDRLFAFAAGQFARFGLHVPAPRPKVSSMMQLFGALRDLSSLVVQQRNAVLKVAQAVIERDGQSTDREKTLEKSLRWCLVCPAEPGV
jgi:Zn-dependent protease with chaperone function